MNNGYKKRDSKRSPFLLSFGKNVLENNKNYNLLD